MIPAIRRVKNSLALILSGEKATGSGFFVGPGLVVTCSHVVKDMGAGMRVSTPDSDPASATLIKSHQELDLALLRTGAQGEPVDLCLRNKAMGTEVGFIGCPFPGLFSPPLVMTHRSLIGNRYELGGVDHYVLDAVVGEGYSGSPVFLTGTGEVVGLIASRFDPLRVAGGWRGAPVSSLTFAVTSRVIAEWTRGK